MNIDLQQDFSDRGVIYLPKLLSDERVVRMRVICEHVLSKWRSGNPQDGKAGIDTPGVYSLTHLNHPGYFEDRRAWLIDVLETAADPAVLGAVGEALGTSRSFAAPACSSILSPGVATAIGIAIPSSCGRMRRRKGSGWNRKPSGFSSSTEPGGCRC